MAIVNQTLEKCGENMTISNDQINRIRRTWAQVATSPDRTADAFYSRLFEAAPQTRAMFKGDMKLQGRKLVNTLAFIVDTLDDLDTLVGEAQDLARRHVTYGVVSSHYADVGEALLDTLKSGLGDQFSDADEEAWASVYDTLSDVMIAATNDTA